MSKHTPGPWNYGEGYIDTHAVDDDGSLDYIILAELHSTFGPDNYGVDQWMLPLEEYEANGRLIAAAPDMLELLNTARTLLSTVAVAARWNDDTIKQLVPECLAFMHASSDILAKIEGGGDD